ncbi:decapping and exoribonuclease protein-like [Copidosoma floridanum]|uniref:decapping and exoribonuclease protein-like n=1 Tax=Copidosoma floridanum TaxID=29053 RepID=UPI0006C97510|nr:decapping and exoribonuclease protein-like [Copidosoma floridanum]
MSFPIRENRSRNFPSFNQPEVVGYFSLTGREREYSQDLVQLKYYYDQYGKQVHFDLDAGINKVVRKPKDLNEKIDFLLRWISNNHGSIRANPGQDRLLKPDFVCFRGLLTKICTTPCESRDGWIICAAKFHGTIYLCAFDNDEQKLKNAHLTDRDLKFMSWGFKFEQYLLTDSPNASPNVKEPVNEAEEFCCLFSSKLGQHALVFGAEMDGICSQDIVAEPVDWKKIKFVELKTNKIIRTEWQNNNYKRKLLKWWCQSFLVGIDNVICGNRTERGIVCKLEDIKVSSMPKLAKNFWNASECLNFCNDFLNHVKTVVVRDYNECIYKFEYKLKDEIEMQMLPSSSELSFLPKWYVDQLNHIANARD